MDNLVLILSYTSGRPRPTDVPTFTNRVQRLRTYNHIFPYRSQFSNGPNPLEDSNKVKHPVNTGITLFSLVPFMRRRTVEEKPVKVETKLSRILNYIYNPIWYTLIVPKYTKSDHKMKFPPEDKLTRLPNDSKPTDLSKNLSSPKFYHRHIIFRWYQTT